MRWRALHATALNATTPPRHHSHQQRRPELPLVRPELQTCTCRKPVCMITSTLVVGVS